MDTSNKGLEIAIFAAAAAFFFPLPVPMPTKDRPASFATVLTSAKSKFINPGIVIRSAIA
ncbi:hypothetical protein ES708_31233 [subsurface metagenome]